MIYFINLSFEGQDERTIQSLGAAYLAAELIKQNIEVRIFDGCGVDRGKDKEELYKELVQLNPQYIGFYVIEHNYDITINFINRLAKEIAPFFFLGGPQVNFGAETIMDKEEKIDFVLIGESEGKLDKIINGDFSVNGLVYRQGNRIINNSMKCENYDLNDLCFPVREIDDKCLLTQEIYKDNSYYVVPISSSRGCPYKCAFCSVPAIVSNQSIKWRFRSAENLEKEIRQIYEKYKKIFIRFIDDNFLVDINRAICVCEKIRDIGDGTIPFSFSGRVDQILALSDKQMKTMKNCGVTAIEVGVENFNEHVLQRYRKNNTVTQTKDALKKLIEYDIYPGIDFIMFDPWTTLEDLNNNYQAIIELGLDSYSPPFLTNRLYPFPGSEYYGSIDINHYFVHADVSMVYSKMMAFIERYKKYKLYLQNGKTNTFILQVFVRLPYKVFGYLINNPTASVESIEIIRKFENMLYKI